MRPVVSIMFTAAMLTSVHAAAQTPRPERPYRGIFGGGVGEAEHLLVVTASAGGGYDDNVMADGGASPAIGGTPPLITGGSSNFGLLAGNLSYSLTREIVSMTVSGGSAANYYFDLENRWLARHSGTIDGSWRLSQGTRLSGYGGVSYEPLYSFGLFPSIADPAVGGAAPIDPTFGTISEASVRRDEAITLSQNLSRRASVSVSYLHSRSDFDSDDLDASMHAVRGTFARAVGEGLNLHFGYGYAVGKYASSTVSEREPPAGHTIDAGIDFNRALSFSRRTTLSFSTGSTAVKDLERTRYYLTGSARLGHEIGRSWDAALAYNRGVEFIDTLREPIFSDSLNFGVGGLITRRLQFRSSAGAAFGEIGLTGAGRSFTSYYGTSGVTYAMSRFVGLAVDYWYYRYTFDDTAALPAGLSPQLNRQRVQASIALWTPLIHRARRSNVTR
jgi:hypothetical protein